jgi:Ras-related protein Rab-18
MQTTDYEVKIIVLGQKGVGKSSLLLNYINQHFDPNNPGTVGMDTKVFL